MNINFSKPCWAIFILIFLISLMSCGEYKKDPPATQEESVKHILRKLNVKTTTSSSSSAFYFLVVGGYSSSTSEETNVRFYFRNCIGEYQFLELSLRDVRIKIDSIAQPYVMFDWDENYRECYNTTYMEWHIKRATIFCNENDFQPEININDLR